MQVWMNVTSRLIYTIWWSIASTSTSYAGKTAVGVRRFVGASTVLFTGPQQPNLLSHVSKDDIIDRQGTASSGSKI
jgi:hypothetical protein